MSRPVKRAAPDPAPADAVQVSVRTVPGTARRWRVGRCFTAEPRVESVSPAECDALMSDPGLVVEIIPATEAAS